MADKPVRPGTPPSPPVPAGGAPGHQGGFGLLARGYWMMVGFVPLVLLALRLARGRGFALSLDDLAYGVFLLALPAVRLADIRYLGGESANHEPVTMRDGWIFSMFVVVGGLALWVAVHLVALVTV